jgi:hypothetical protein
MKTIDWNQAAELGLLERINREILHPLGLAACRDVDSGVSRCLIVSDDGFFEFAADMQTKIISNDEVIKRLSIITGGVE